MQPAKASLPIEVTLAGNSSVVILVPAKATEPILVRLELGANVTEVMPLLLEKAYWLIEVTFAGITTEPEQALLLTTAT